MKRRLSFFHACMLAFITALLSGCATLGDALFADYSNILVHGYIITYTQYPYTRDLDNTPFEETEQGGKIVRITEPISGYGMYTELMTNAIGDIAEENGIKEIYFC